MFFVWKLPVISAAKYSNKSDIIEVIDENCYKLCRHYSSDLAPTIVWMQCICYLEMPQLDHDIVSNFLI